jgi:hypothetical protein
MKFLLEISDFMLCIPGRSLLLFGYINSIADSIIIIL